MTIFHISELARELSRAVQDILSSLPLSFSEAVPRRLVDLKRGTSYLYRQHAALNNPKEINSAVENTYFVCSQDRFIPTTLPLEQGIEKWGRLGTSALLLLVSHMMSEPAFDTLRTKEQLGYIVSTSTVRFVSGHVALRIIVSLRISGVEF
jgi:insulysin